MSIRLVGELLTPISCPMAGVTIHLKALDTSASVLFSSEASVKTDYKGRYEFTVPTGLYLVSLDNGISSAELGQIQVYSDSAESTLQALLDAPKTEPSPIWLQQLEEKVAEATKQAGIATNAANEATTAAKTVKDNVDAAKQHADRAYASATNAAKSEVSASADAVSAEESAVRAEEAAAISQSLSVVNQNLFVNGDFSVNQRNGLNVSVSNPTFVSDCFAVRPQSLVGGTITSINHDNQNGTYVSLIHSGATSNSYILQNVETTGWALTEGSYPLPSDKLTVSFGFRIAGRVEDMKLTVSIAFLNKDKQAISQVITSDAIIVPSGTSAKRYAVTLDVPPTTGTTAISSQCVMQVYINYAGVSGKVPDGRYDFNTCKAEWGSVSTQLIQDDPALNLLKCRRRFWKGALPGNGYQSQRLNKYFFENFQIPLDMQGAIPSIKLISGSIYNQVGSRTQIAPNAGFKLHSVSNDTFTVEFNADKYNSAGITSAEGGLMDIFVEIDNEI